MYNHLSTRVTQINPFTQEKKHALFPTLYFNFYAPRYNMLPTKKRVAKNYSTHTKVDNHLRLILWWKSPLKIVKENIFMLKTNSSKNSFTPPFSNRNPWLNLSLKLLPIVFLSHISVYKRMHNFHVHQTHNSIIEYRLAAWKIHTHLFIKWLEGI